MNSRIRTALVVMVSLVWSVNFTVPIFNNDYKPPEGVNVAFMAIVGYLTTGYGKGDKDKSNKGDES